MREHRTDPARSLPAATSRRKNPPSADESARQAPDPATELRERVLMAEAQVKLAAAALARNATRKAAVHVKNAAGNLKVAVELARAKRPGS